MVIIHCPVAPEEKFGFYTSDGDTYFWEYNDKNADIYLTEVEVKEK